MPDAWIKMETLLEKKIRTGATFSMTGDVL